MTQEYDNTNRGVLFKNDRKETDKHPNLKGRADVVCSHCGKTTPVWVDAWTKLRENGEKWLSLAFKAREPRKDAISSPATGQTAPGATQYPQTAPVAATGAQTDDLPF